MTERNFTLSLALPKHSPEVRSLRIIYLMKLIKLLKNPPDWLAVVLLTVGIVVYLISLGVIRNLIHQ